MQSSAINSPKITKDAINHIYHRVLHLGWSVNLIIEVRFGVYSKSPVLDYNSAKILISGMKR